MPVGDGHKMVYAILKPVIVFKLGKRAALMIPIQKEGPVAAPSRGQLLIEQILAVRADAAAWNRGFQDKFRESRAMMNTQLKADAAAHAVPGEGHALQGEVIQ